jgi:glycine hydroxymethyltransferase
MEDDLAARLRASLAHQEDLLRSTLILNPVENVPFTEDLLQASGILHGLYNSDKQRSRSERINTPIQFAGRQAMESDSREIYAAWAQALGAEDATLRLLSGLHAHIVLFMAMAQPGQKVLLLPVTAGGHVSGKAILRRLGLEVVEMAVDVAHQGVDIAETLNIWRSERPDYVLVDRSEGLVFEDFSQLAQLAPTTTIFDASQYLTNVICGHDPNPIGWGFDLVIASVHKNFPGPQKAVLATRRVDDRWRRILSGISTFVSNMHMTSTYAAGLTLARTHWLKQYSSRMLEIAVSLETELALRGVPVIRRPDGLPTHHLWIREDSREAAYETYDRLERCQVLTNFRQLPYSLGFGLRLGTSAVARLGLVADDVPILADLIADIRRAGPTSELRRTAASLSEMLWERAELGSTDANGRIARQTLWSGPPTEPGP